MTIAALFLAFAGFTLMALSMSRHRPQILGPKCPAAPGWIRMMASWLALALALSLAVRLLPENPSLAIARWLGVLTFAALAAAMALTYRPALLRYAPPAAVLCAVAMRLTAA